MEPTIILIAGLSILLGAALLVIGYLRASIRLRDEVLEEVIEQRDVCYQAANGWLERFRTKVGWEDEMEAMRHEFEEAESRHDRADMLAICRRALERFAKSTAELQEAQEAAIKKKHPNINHSVKVSSSGEIPRIQV